MAWYKEPNWWAATAATVALILTQLPPVRTWFAKPDVDVDIAKRLTLPTALGIPGFQTLINIRNQSAKGVDISDLRLEVLYPNGKKVAAPALTFVTTLANSSGPQDFAITSLSLAPSSNWSATVLFGRNQTPNENEEIARHRIQIAQSLPARVMQPGENLPVADSGAVAAARGFFDKNFDLEKGQYAIDLRATVNGIDRSLSTATFTLYDFHISTLRGQTVDFPYGMGVLSPPHPARQIWVPLVAPAGVSRGG